MVSLREKLAASDTDAALRIVVDARPKLFSKVAELRAAHLKGGGELTDRTRDSYASDVRRVSKAGGNPGMLAGTAASFRKLRAACQWKAREDLRECLARADRARKKGGIGELEALCIYDENLAEIESRLACLAALRFNPAQATRRDKTHMQRHKLGRLPDDWISRVHAQTRGGKYGEAVVVGILIPVRPEEIANRIRVKLDASGALLFEVKGSKLRDTGSGIASHVEGIGQPLRWLTLTAVDLARQEAFDWLRDRVIAEGGTLTVGKGISASGVCSAFRSMSRRLFDRSKSPPSFYALRHAACAELKASGLGAEEVAQGMGHASALSQRAYGIRSQGSGGYVVETTASAPVRLTNPSTLPPSAFRNGVHPTCAVNWLRTRAIIGQ
jgi:integrase